MINIPSKHMEKHSKFYKTTYKNTVDTLGSDFKLPKESAEIKVTNEGSDSIFLTIPNHVTDVEIKPSYTHIQKDIQSDTFTVKAQSRTQEFHVVAYSEDFSQFDPEYFNAQLAETSQKVDNLASGSPDGVYDTLTDLETAYPTGDTRIKLVLADDNWYYWDGASWTPGGLYQSSNESGTMIYDESIQNIESLFIDQNDLTYDAFLDETGTLKSSSYTVTGFVACDPSMEYSLNYHRLTCFYDSNQNFLSSLSTAQTTSYTFVTPPDTAFLRTNVYEATVPISEFYINPPNAGQKTIYTLKDAVKAENKNTSIWLGKNWVTLGDSITHVNGYQPLMKLKMGFSYILNKGDSGKPMANGTANGDGTNTAGKAIDYLAYDLVTIAAGTNDFKLNVPLGTLGQIGDSAFDDTTFYGAYRDLIEYILTSQPKIRICLWTPLQRDNSGYDVNYTNSAGHKLIDYVNAIKEIGEMYGIPVCDMYANSGITKLNLTTYTTDGLHPNDAGFERMANFGVKFIESIGL